MTLGKKSYIFFVKLGEMSTNFSQIGNLPFRFFFLQIENCVGHLGIFPAI